MHVIELLRLSTEIVHHQVIVLADRPAGSEVAQNTWLGLGVRSLDNPNDVRTVFLRHWKLQCPVLVSAGEQGAFVIRQPQHFCPVEFRCDHEDVRHVSRGDLHTVRDTHDDHCTSADRDKPQGTHQLRFKWQLDLIGCYYGGLEGAIGQDEEVVEHFVCPLDPTLVGERAFMELLKLDICVSEFLECQVITLVMWGLFSGICLIRMMIICRQATCNECRILMGFSFSG